MKIYNQDEVERGEYNPWHTTWNDVLAGVGLIIGLALILIYLVAFR